MIPQKYRVPRQLIPKILKKGEEFFTKLFICRSIKNDGHFSRYRVIISKKLDPKAVNRNKLRRQIYEAVRLKAVGHAGVAFGAGEKDDEKTEGTDYIFIPKKSIKSSEYSQIESELKKIINGKA